MSRGNERQVDVSGTACPEVVRSLRLGRGWDTHALAARAGISERTIRQLERRQRDTFLEFTLLQIAAALDTTLPALLGGREARTDAADAATVPAPLPGPAPTPEPARVPSAPRRRRWAVGLAVVVVLGALAVLALRPDRGPLLVERGDAGLVARDKAGKVAWRLPTPGGITFCDASPWRAGTLLVGLRAAAGDSGHVLLLEERTGRVIWNRTPDFAHLQAAFGQLLPDSEGGFTPTVWEPVDFDGDAEPEIAVVFLHVWFWPTSVLFLGSDGRLLSQYDNRGHLSDLLAVDLDADGRQELLASGTNNAPCYQGATVLLFDDACRAGAAVDTAGGGNFGYPDSARVRLIMPSFGSPYMGLLGELRIEARQLRANRDKQGRTWITLYAGAGKGGLIVTLDSQLRPRSALPTDQLRVESSSWPPEALALNGLPEQRWIDEVWLPRAVRFETGRRVAGGAGMAAGGQYTPSPSVLTEH